MPFLMLDPVVYPYIYFHTQYVLPFVLEKFQIILGTKDSEKLLLDDRNGKPLKSDNIRHTFSSWVRNIDGELRITPMDLRSAYATIMIRRHAQREELPEECKFAFRHMDEDEFLTMLGCVMNTGKEQLRDVYSAASHAEVRESCSSGYGYLSQR